MIRVRDASLIDRLVASLIAGGITALEVTMTVPGAVQVIETLAADVPPGVVVGAGTVMDAATVRQVVSAGARFVVSPVFDPSLMPLGQSLGAAVVPGSFTPTEIRSATAAGADIVKIFPAGPLGPGFIKDLLGPMPHLKLMPTGGVTLANAADWFRAGAVAVGIGSALIDSETLRQGRFDELTIRTRALMASIHASRDNPRAAGQPG